MSAVISQLRLLKDHRHSENECPKLTDYRHCLATNTDVGNGKEMTERRC